MPIADSKHPEANPRNAATRKSVWTFFEEFGIDRSLTLTTTTALPGERTLVGACAAMTEFVLDRRIDQQRCSVLTSVFRENRRRPIRGLSFGGILMRNHVVLALAAVTLAIVPSGWVHAQKGATSAAAASSPGWFGRLNPFSWGGTQKTKKKANEATPKPKPERNELTPEMRREMFDGIVAERERKAWERRIACCNKIIEIADYLGDAKLRRRAEMLSHRIDRIYNKRTSNIPVGPPLNLPVENTSFNYTLPEGMDSSTRANRR